MKIHLSNDFHGTDAAANIREIGRDQYGPYFRINKRVARRLRNELCGSPDCTCGDTFGARGENPMEILSETADGLGYIVRVEEP